MDHNLARAFVGSWSGTELVWAGCAQEAVTIGADFDDVIVSDYGMDILFGTQKRNVSVKSESLRVGTATYDLPSNLVDAQSHTQVVLTTHSPYAVDLFEPEEVTLCAKSETGEMKTTRMPDSPDVIRQLGVFTLGEIWIAEGDEKIAESKDQPQGAGE